jgi:cobalt-precorrin-5B (C1)-methyltransferase
MAKRLRSGFTTGAVSAAAAKAAAKALLSGECPASIEIPFPDGKRHSFTVFSCTINDHSATATIVKDAGDDPDVTNRAKISATVSPLPKVQQSDRTGSSKNCVNVKTIQLCRGEGVGYVTKPGLAAAVGEPAINPVPREMIADGVAELTGKPLRVTISIEGGALLAEKTLNYRLGIVGGLSILGTTGIVRPVSADAWTATISASMNVAREAGLSDIVLSTGRTSEKGAQNLLDLPVEAFAMMGDYLQFSLQEAAEKNFTTIHISAMWAKIMKAALEIPQTHVRHGALETQDAAALLEKLGAGGELLTSIRASNTARQMLGHIQSRAKTELITAVCKKARDYAVKVSGRQVRIYLIDHRAELIERV